MSVRWVEITKDIELSKNIDFELDGSRVYSVLADQADDEIAVAAGISSHYGIDIYTPHPSNSRLIVVGLNLKQSSESVGIPGTADVGYLWLLTVTYGQWNPLEHAVDGNPLNVPLRWWMENEVVEVPAYVDVDGNPIVNSAGDPFDPPLMRKVQITKLHVRRNESAATISIPNLIAVGNTVNLNAWNSFPPKTVYLNPVKIPEVGYSQVEGFFYYPFQYDFEINYDTWVAQVLNAGLRQLVNGNLVPIVVDGQFATTPVPLDETGRAILAPQFLDFDGDTVPDTSPTGPSGAAPGGGQPPLGGTGTSSASNFIMLCFDKIRAWDFSGLNMDNLFTLPSL